MSDNSRALSKAAREIAAAGYEILVVEPAKVADLAPVEWPAAALRVLRNVVTHFECGLMPDGEVRLVCSRCRRVFSYPLRGRWQVPAMHLRAHLLRHKIDAFPADSSARGGVKVRRLRGRKGGENLARGALPGV